MTDWLAVMQASRSVAGVEAAAHATPATTTDLVRE